MNKKAGEISINKLIVIILIVLVIVVVLMFTFTDFRGKFFNWIKNLPEYKYEYDEEVVPKGDGGGIEAKYGEYIGGLGNSEGTIVFRKQYFYFKDTGKTQFYLDEEKIKINSIIVGTLDKDKKIIINKNYFEPLSKEFDDIRMKVGDDSWKQLAQLDKAVLGPSNILFRKEASNLIGKRPSVIEDSKVIRLDLTNFEKIEREFRISFPKTEDLGRAKFLYLKKEKNYIKIMAYISYFERYAIGEISPDSSIFFDEESVRALGIKIKDYFSKYNAFRKKFETNFKVDYYKVLSIF